MSETNEQEPVKTIPVTFELIQESMLGLRTEQREARHHLEVYFKQNGLPLPSSLALVAGRRNYDPRADESRSALVATYAMMSELHQEQQGIVEMTRTLWDTLGPDAWREIKPLSEF